MDKALLGSLLILLVFLIMAPGIMWINYRFNDNPEETDDLSNNSLVKLDIKKSLLNILNQWIKENNLSHNQVADKLSTNLKVVSNIVYQRFDKFTLDSLVDLVLRTGQSVKFALKKDE